MPAPEKLIVMRGDRSLFNWADAEDYRFWGNREYIRSKAKWVRFWVLFRNLDGIPLNSQNFAIWDALNVCNQNDDYDPSSPGSRRRLPALQKLDRQILAAKQDGLKVILTIGWAYPTWVTGTTSTQDGTGKSPTYRWPADLSTKGPWSWFVGHFAARYNYFWSTASGKAPNPLGPRAAAVAGETPQNYSVTFGNPAGTYIDALEVLNEPNHFNWPQEGGATYAAAMLYTAYSWLHSFGAPALLAPATLDRGGGTTVTPSGQTVAEATNYSPFADDFIRQLNAWGFNPTVGYVGFSHHNYGDIKERFAYGDSRTRTIKLSLGANKWKGSGTDRDVYLTEGGYDLSQTVGENYAAYSAARQDEERRRQQDRMNFNLGQMTDYNDAAGAVGAVRTFAQYSVHDIPGDTFQSGLRENFSYANGLPVGPGATRPLHGSL